MKKFLATSLLLLSSIVIFISCEKDDICGETEPTTPGLFVEFYNYEDQNVPRLETITAYAVGQEEHTIESSGNKLLLPFRLDQQETSWVLNRTIGTGIEKVILKDTLSFKYRVTTTYLNKACGYVSTFSLLQNGTSPLLNGKEDSKEGNWIKLYETLTNEIENDETAHFQIYY